MRDVMLRKPKFKRYASAATVFRAFGGGEPDDVAAEMLSYIEKQGYWGFADTRKGVVHFWFSSKCHLEDAVFFFAHEFGHMSGRSLKGVAEEHRANGYASAALLAIRMARLELGEPDQTTSPSSRRAICQKCRSEFDKRSPNKKEKTA